MEVLSILTSITIILLFGLMISLVTSKLKLPNVLFLIIFGIILGNIYFNGSKLELPPVFMSSIAILAMVMIVFTGTSNLKLSELNKLWVPSLKLFIIFFALNIIFLSFISYFGLGFNSLYFGFVFAALMIATATDVVVYMIPKMVSKVTEILEIESIINTPFTVLVPFIILDFMKSINYVFVMNTFISQIIPFLQQIIVGIGTGFVLGIISVRIMKLKYSEQYSPIATLILALLAYILSENMGGSGILGVTTLGIIFGNFYVKEKDFIQKYSSIFALSLEILVFVLIGMIITLPRDWVFYAKLLSVYAIYFVIRYFSVHIAFGSQFTRKEKIFMSLNMPKGIAVASAAFLLSMKNIPGIEKVLTAALCFMLLSIITATIAAKYYRYFLLGPEKIEKRIEKHRHLS